MQINMDSFDTAKVLTLTRPASEGGKGRDFRVQALYKPATVAQEGLSGLKS